ncbi:MAG TPA: hypothetical protein VJB13_00580 [Candidatus Nanoarchaeia archaeon]|nr:hypothetical protein [Candidatus Nanoarchaeia archaeon]
MLLRAAVEYAAAKIYAPVFEVIAHKYILHGLGKNKDSEWSFHWHGHHKTVRKDGMLDEDYFGPILANSSAQKEIKALAGVTLLHFLLLVPFFPVFAVTTTAHAIEYYVKHYKCHTDVKYAFDHLPHHVKHHLVDQNANWGVTSDIVDRIIGTATEVDDEEWARLRKFYTQRAVKARPRIEAAAAERKEEYQQKLKDSLEQLAERMYSFLGRK